MRDPERWLWRTVFRVAAGEMHDRRRRNVVTAEGSYQMEEPALDLVRALPLLSPKQRASVVLHDALGYSSREIAAMLPSTAAAVRVHLMRGRRRLRELLEDDSDT